MQNLIESLKGSVLEAPILLMGLLGLRYSEACGLRWSDVDFENNIININQIIIYQGSAGTFFKEPKTNKSKRSLHAPGELMQILKKERNNQNKLKLQGILENKHDLVCLNTFFNPWSNNTITHFFERFLKKNNIRKIRLHDLRHTNATLMLLSGTNIKIVSDRLGHTDIKISMNKYSHVLEEMDQQASNNLSNILFK
ncbi:MAG: site-specific integrase [Clostridia bacterium]